MFLLTERKTTGKYLAFREKISIFVEVMNTTKWIFFSFVDFIIVINDCNGWSAKIGFYWIRLSNVVINSFSYC